MIERYILEGHNPVPEPDLLKWAEWFEDVNRLIDVTYVTNNLRVSTVFLGLDHNLMGGPPLLFETMVFRRLKTPKVSYALGSRFQFTQEILDRYTDRHHTFEEARLFHNETVKLVEKSIWQRLRKSKKQTQRTREKRSYHAA